MTAENIPLDPNIVDYCIEASQWFQDLVDDDPNQDWRSARAKHALENGVDLDSRSPAQIGGVSKTSKS
jgi:hypothetical protein